MSDKTEIWHLLQKTNKILEQQSIAELLDSDARRFAAFSCQIDGLTFDFSRTLLNQQALDLLLQLPDAMNLAQARQQLFDGAQVNFTELRPALHTLLRAQTAPHKDLQPALADIRAELEKTFNLAAHWRDKSLSGEITDIVHIGIGGSLLGPQLLHRAFADNTPDNLRLHYLGNVDEVAQQRLFKRLSAEKTLVFLVSKSFTTTEVLINGKAVNDWLKAELGPVQAARQLYAITSDIQAAQAWGIGADNILRLWDWVGGRYSVWSSVSLLPVILLGESGFKQFLAGAEAIDQHFLQQPWSANLPVLMALVGIWHRNIRGHAAQAVIAYHNGLRELPAYLQQLDMESNGKRTNQQAEVLQHDSAPLLLAGSGTESQHSIFQALHQGTQTIPVEFVGVVGESFRPDTTDNYMLANLLAQASVLARGRGREEVASELRQQGAGADQVNTLAAHAEMPGCRPSTLLLLDTLTPYRLGQLLALYEHKTFVQSVIWGINSFDQMGVSLGKQTATALQGELADGSYPDHRDTNLVALLKQLAQKDH